MEEVFDYEKLTDEINQVSDNIAEDGASLPDRTMIVDLLKKIQVLLLPTFFHYNGFKTSCRLREIESELASLICQISCANYIQSDSALLARKFLLRLKDVKKLIFSDMEAIYDGDPAALSKAEIILCYPGFYASMIYRIAHELYVLKIPFIPRVMSEYAHEKTGIDINPGAKIGHSFCIDHGTGIVIGETATLGHHVKLYQGVTIGAKSFDLDENGNPIKGGKRHPDIGNHVVVYAGATILGGDTKVGDGCVIGGNVWLTHSIEDNRTITYRPCAAQ